MSGRLIILPKKSWHVGKRENIEKVLRDERIAEEQAAAARERSRETTQEGIVETLLKRSRADESQRQTEAALEPPDKKRKRKTQSESGALGGTGQGWGGGDEHVNLFGREEREADKITGKNLDHECEKREQELRAQQRSGLAPTAFGEGSAELMNVQPWYNENKSLLRPSGETSRAVRLGREVTGQEAEAVIKRDKGRKIRHDPMGSFFRSHESLDKSLGTADGASSRISPIDAEETVSTTVPTEMTDEGNASDKSTTRGAITGRQKHTKRDKQQKKEKKKKKRASGKSSQHGGSRVDRGGSTRSQGDIDEESYHSQQQDLGELRRRRLAREGGERAREIRLLAEREMAGQAIPNERGIAYNNQYNAPAARQNKLHDHRNRYG